MAERRLRISVDVTLPLEAVTETFAILAKRGVGKTYAGAVLAEEMVGAGAQVVILDPLDAWWGLRSSADGNGEGLPLYVFGGEHGDLPLEASAGELLADVVVDHGISAIFSLRHLSKTAQRRFVADFAERLYHRKGEPEHRTPLHVFIDEADAFVPQRVLGESARMVGAIDDLVRRGRSSGIGVTLISQRAAVVNKDVLTQAEVLVALRTISPQDRKALDLWVEAHDAHDQRGPFMESLASLDVGEAWLWSPGWLDIFQRVRIRRRRTFDSSATPKAGARAVQPKQRADVDLEQLGERIQETVERAKADDPKELRKRIRELEREAAAMPTEQVTETVVERVEVPVLNGQVGDLKELVRELVDVGQTITSVGDRIIAAIDRVATANTAPGRPPRAAQAVAERPHSIPSPRPAASAAAVSAPPATDIALGRGERTTLIAVAQYPEGAARDQLSVLTGYKRSSRNTYLQRLMGVGLVEPAGGDMVRATDAGIDALGSDYEPLPEGEALQDYWRAKLPEGERRVFDVLVAAYPDAVPREQIDQQTGYKRSSRNTYLQRLKSRRLVENVGSDEIRASEDLF